MGEGTWKYHERLGWMAGCMVTERGLSMGGTWSGVWLELCLDLSYWVLKGDHYNIANQQQHGMEVRAWRSASSGLGLYIDTIPRLGDTTAANAHLPTLLFQGCRSGCHKGDFWEPARAIQLTQPSRLKFDSDSLPSRFSVGFS